MAKAWGDCSHRAVGRGGHPIFFVVSRAKLLCLLALIPNFLSRGPLIPGLSLTVVQTGEIGYRLPAT
jgi:hypothetical protein